MSDLQHERITALTAELRLGAMADLYGAIAQDAAKRKDASYADFLEQVLRAERDARRVRSASMLARTAGFPAIKTLEDYDFWLCDRRTKSPDPRTRLAGLCRAH